MTNDPEFGCDHHRARLVDNIACLEVAAGAETAPAVLPAHLQVLVVDDNRDTADSIADCLRTFYEFGVTVAYRGSDAMQLMESSHPDAIVLDIGMPQIDGLQVARWIRLRPWGRTVPLIALTAWSQPADRQRTSAAGFDRHLTKPVDADYLAAELRALIALVPGKQ
jgi:CheY-like chemotaxis protein